MPALPELQWTTARPLLLSSTEQMRTARRLTPLVCGATQMRGRHSPSTCPGCTRTPFASSLTLTVISADLVSRPLHTLVSDLVRGGHPRAVLRTARSLT